MLRRSDIRDNQDTDVTAAAVGDVTDKRNVHSQTPEPVETYHETYESSDQRLLQDAPDGASGSPTKERDRVTEMPASPDTLSFRVRSHGIPAYLVISSWGLRLARSHQLALNPKKHRREELWSCPFSHLTQIAKTHSSTTSKLVGGDPNLSRLIFEFTPFDVAKSKNYIKSPSGQNGGKEDTADIQIIDVDHAQRDEIFNLVVGWSKSRWRVMSAREVDDKKKSPKLTTLLK